MSTKNELFQYVEAADPEYRWEQATMRAVLHGTLYELRLTSQTWQKRPWTHRLSVFVPERLANSSWAMLTIGSDAPAHQETSHIDMDAARRLGVVFAHLYDIPNQPLFEGLREDELMAHSLRQYLDTDDPTWPLLYPMVKAVVRAMDAVASFRRDAPGGAPERFILHGASKRGWASWLASVVDPRVGAIVPEVYDNLNLFAQMPHQVKVWDTYSEMIDDYTEQRLQDKMRTPRGHQLAVAIDPYSYRQELSLPKLLIHATNDRYWATDALNLYWDDLQGDKCILYEPNQGHHIAERARVRPTMNAFLRSVIDGAKLPQVTSEYEEQDTELRITLRPDVPALEARVWTAKSAGQDFRTARWEASPLSATAGGTVFVGSVKRPSTGHIALVAECLLPHDELPYLLSTQIRLLGSTRD